MADRMRRVVVLGYGGNEKGAVGGGWVHYREFVKSASETTKTTALIRICPTQESKSTYNSDTFHIEGAETEVISLTRGKVTSILIKLLTRLMGNIPERLFPLLNSKNYRTFKTVLLSVCQDADGLVYFWYPFTFYLILPIIKQIKKSNPKFKVIIQILDYIWDTPPHYTLPFRLLNLFFHLELGRILKHSDYVIIPNEVGVAYIKRKYPQYTSKILFNQSTFVNTEIFNDLVDANLLKRKYEGHYPVILVPTADLTSKRKDLKSAIEGLNNILSQYSSALLLITGDGYQHSPLPKMVDHLSLRNNVTFAGRLTPQAMARHYALADLVVYPSIFESGQPPRSVAEPMAMGKCVIASEACDIKGFLRNSIIRFKTGDARDLTEKLLSTLSNPDNIKTTGEKAKAMILQRGSVASFRSNVQRIVSQALE